MNKYHKKEKRECREYIKQQTFEEHINPNRSKMSINHQDQQDYSYRCHCLETNSDRLLLLMNQAYHWERTLLHRDDAKMKF